MEEIKNELVLIREETELSKESDLKESEVHPGSGNEIGFSEDSESDCDEAVISKATGSDKEIGFAEHSELDEAELVQKVFALADYNRVLEEQNKRYREYFQTVGETIKQSKESINNVDAALLQVQLVQENFKSPKLTDLSLHEHHLQEVHSNQFKQVGTKGNQSLQNVKVQLVSEKNKSLEEQNNRLKEYIKQLQKSIVKTSDTESDDRVAVKCNSTEKRIALSLDSVVAGLMPDDIEIEIAEDPWVSGQNPLLNALVLQNVISKLDYQSLKESRLISQSWNNVALPIMIKKTVVSLHSFRSDDKNITEEGIQGLRTVMENGPCELFSNLQIEVQLLEKTDCQALLSNFGMYVKLLEIDEDATDAELDPKYLYSILTEWCPNLESLDISNLKIAEESVVKLFDTLGTEKPLSLTSFEFDVSEKDAKLAQILFSIANASPKLTCLKGYLHPRVLMEFFVRTQNNTKITRNLERLDIDGSERNYVIPIEIFSQLDIEFGDNFKCLSLGSFNPFPRANLFRMLKKVASSLESLILFGQDNADGNNYTYGEIQLPQMKKLKVFKNFGAEEYRIKSIDVFADFRSLETLVLSGSHNAPLSKDRLDVVFANCVELMRNPHTKVKKLILLGLVTSLRTLLTINRIFPNVSTLYLKLGHGEKGISNGRPSEKREWFREAIEAIYSMESLKTLYLDFQEFQLVDAVETEYDLTAKFGTLPELRSLTLVNGQEDGGPRFLPYFVEALYKNTPKLQHLKLVDFEMALTDAKSLFDTMEGRSVMLEITDDPPSYEQF